MCTVKPSSDYRYCDTHNASGHTEYAEIDLKSLKTKDDDDSDEESLVSQSKTDQPRSNSDPELKRHSLPTVLPDSLSKATAKRDKDNELNYLELNFPDRPRNQSDGSRSPRIPPRSSKPQSRPGAYIELEFNSKDSKSQDSTSDRVRSSSGSGDGKSSSLPRY